MNKRQVGKLVDFVAGSWNLKHTPTQRDVTIDAWNRLLFDLDYDDADRAVATRAMAGGFPPKPATIRIDVLRTQGKVPPTTAEALAQAKALTDAIRHGTAMPETHPLVKETIREIGTQHDIVFKERYDEKMLTHLADLLPSRLS